MSAEDYHADFYYPPEPNGEDESHLTHHPACPHYQQRFSEACICAQLLAALRGGATQKDAT